MILEAIASATLANQDIGGGYVTAFSGTLAGTDNRNVIATTRITGRDGGSTVDISFRVTVGSLLKADETIEYIGTAGAAIELQSFTFSWGAGQTLTIQVQSSDPLDADCGLQVLIEAEQGGGEIDNDAIATAVVEKAVSDSQPVGSVGYILHSLSTMIEFIGGFWRFKSTAVTEVPIPAESGDWSITRTFQVASGDKVSGVRMSLVGVAGKADTTGTDGIATIKADDDTFTLRVVVPAGYEDIPDTTVTINGADNAATVTLVSGLAPPAQPGLCNVSLPVTDGAGTGQVGAKVRITFLRFAPGATPTATVIPPVPVQTSISPGVVTVQLLRLGTYHATYSYGSGTKDFEFIVPDAGTFTVVERV